MNDINLKDQMIDNQKNQNNYRIINNFKEARVCLFI